MPDKITVSEALTWQKTLKERHSELTSLRNANSSREITYYGHDNDKERKKEPLYDVKALDRQIVTIARELRLLDEAIKRSNATVVLSGFERNDDVLGELQ